MRHCSRPAGGCCRIRCEARPARLSCQPWIKRRCDDACDAGGPCDVGEQAFGVHHVMEPASASMLISARPCCACRLRVHHVDIPTASRTRCGTDDSSVRPKGSFLETSLRKTLVRHFPGVADGWFPTGFAGPERRPCVFAQTAARVRDLLVQQASRPAYLAKIGMAHRNIPCREPHFNTCQVSKNAPKSIGRSISPPRINPSHELPTCSVHHVLSHHRTH